VTFEGASAEEIVISNVQNKQLQGTSYILIPIPFSDTNNLDIF
jgi:hypothetical protein